MNPTRPPAWRSSGRTPLWGCSEVTASKIVCRVLAPPEAPGRKPRILNDVTPTQGPTSSGDFWSSTTSFASQLLSHFKVPAFAAPSPDVVLREASTKERELQRTTAPVDVSAFLSPVGIWEVKHLRKLSSLTALTYYMHLVTPRRLQRLHGLELVTTSRACDIRPYEHNKTAEEVGADGDGMAVSISEARQVYQLLKRDGGGQQPNKGGDSGSSSSAGNSAAAAAPGSSNIVTLTREMPYQVLPAGPPAPSRVAPTAGTGMDAAAAAATAAGPVWPIPPALAGPPQQQSAQQSQQGPASSAGGGSGSAGAPPPGPPVITAPARLPRMLRSPAEAMATKLTEAAVAASAAAAAAENFYAGLASLPIGSALVGANNRASNTLLPSSSASSASAASADSAGAGSTGHPTSASTAVNVDSSPKPTSSSSPSSASTAPGAPAASGPGAESGASFLGGGRKATAAAIAAMTTERIRQQALLSFTGGARNGTAPTGPATTGSGGLAPVTASGLLTSLPSSGASTTAPATGGAPAGAPSGPGSTSTSPAAAAATGSQSAPYLCPSEWFVVDDTASNTRIFVIQGSDTLDHWKLNLTFDPVVFEDPALGVKVHRGVYEAALVLYERFLPLVYEHLESSPFSKISFTGHSVGGSLATLLMLMYRIRGVLPVHSIGNVYTFGAPSVFCQTQPLPSPRQHHHHHGHDQHGHHHHHGGHHHHQQGNAHSNGHGAGHHKQHQHRRHIDGAHQHHHTATVHNSNGRSHHGDHHQYHGNHQHQERRNGHPSYGTHPADNGHSDGHAHANGHAHVNGHANGHANGKAYADGHADGHRHDHHHHHHGGSNGHRRGQAHSASASSAPLTHVPLDGSNGLEVEAPSPAAAASLLAAAKELIPGSSSLPRALTGPLTSSSPFSYGGSFCSCSSDDLLERLGLQPSIVRNVLMARDVVPRAFACDYSPVADILRTWGASFKEHCCLSRTGRKHLYYFIGRMCILQPDHWHTFVNNDPYHPMLPPGPEIYNLVEPTAVVHTVDHAAETPAAAALREAQRGVVQEGQQRPRAAAGSVMEALWELMDCPHPLETLADPGAYMASGIISRYHNPEHYTKALGRVRHLKRQAEKRVGEAVPGGDGSRRSSARRARERDPADAASTAGEDERGFREEASALGGRCGEGIYGAGGADVAAPWDSSDGLDLDLRGVGLHGFSQTGGDAHAHAHVCR